MFGLDDVLASYSDETSLVLVAVVALLLGLRHETDPDHLREELGDLLLQVVFHARLGEEHEDPWSIDDVASGIVEKLIRRHPHVFADGDATTAAHVEARWHELKQAEKRRSSAVEGIPVAQPALSLAATLLNRAESAGIAPTLPDLVVPDPADPTAVGDATLALVAAARRHGVDVEQALRDAARRFADAVRRAESPS